VGEFQVTSYVQLSTSIMYVKATRHFYYIEPSDTITMTQKIHVRGRQHYNDPPAPRRTRFLSFLDGSNTKL